MILSECPVGAQIGDISIPSPLCVFNAGQIRKVIVQRKYSSGTTRNSLTYANAALLANWQTLLSATDSTKVQVSIELANPTMEPGDIKTYGSGNEVPGGVPIIVGEDISVFNAEFLGASPQSIKSMRDWHGEDLAIWFINEHGQILADSDDGSNPATVYGVDAVGFFVGSRNFGGLDVPDKNSLRITLDANWDANLVRITPSNFNALTDLAGS